MKFPVPILAAGLAWVGFGFSNVPAALSALPLQPISQSAVTSGTEKSLPEFNNILMAHARKPVSMKLNIVTHTCPVGSAEEIVAAISGMP